MSRVSAEDFASKGYFLRHKIIFDWQQCHNGFFAAVVSEQKEQHFQICKGEVVLLYVWADNHKLSGSDLHSEDATNSKKYSIWK